MDVGYTRHTLLAPATVKWEDRMKAICIREIGDKRILQYEEVPDPTFGPRDVLVRVRAASVNGGDLGLRDGMSIATSLSEPLIIGWDVAGDVADVGSEVEKTVVGQRVVLARLPRGEGGYAELIAVPETFVVPIPDNMDYDQAASLPVAFLTAWSALLANAKLKEGETALIQAAGSGVGMAAIQIAKQIAKAQVFTTAGSDEKVSKATELGADVAINYSTQNFLSEVQRLTDGHGVQVALDVVGGEVFSRTQQSLASYGRLVSVGRSSGIPAEPDHVLAKLKHHEVITRMQQNVEEDPENLAMIVKLVSEGTLTPVIDRVFPLSEAVEAHHHLRNRAQFGKVILRP